MTRLTSYRDLIVWQKSVSLVELIYEVTEKFPKTEQFGLTNQMRRCSVSIPSCIAEGFGRQTSKDYAQFLTVAYGSALELETQVEISLRLGFISHAAFDRINLLLQEVIKMLGAIKFKVRSLNARHSSLNTMKWMKDSQIQNELNSIIERIEFDHIQKDRVFAYRTNGSTARAYARIWSFPKIFQEVLDEKPAYVIEVISEKFDKLKDKDKQKVLIHELLHIPKNFSGSLLPHKFGNKRIDKEVDRLYKMMEEK